MNQFNVHKWKNNQLLKEAGLLNENQVSQVVKAIDSAISSVDDSLSYKVLASAVAQILKDEYGSHNFGPFMEVLHAELGIEESLNEAEDIPSFLKDLAQELEGKYPELKFYADDSKIEVIGLNQDKSSFADENLKKDWGNGFTTFDIDDDDRGYMVSITRVNRF